MDHYACSKKYHSSDNSQGKYYRIKIRGTRGNLRATVRSQLAHLTSNVNGSYKGQNNDRMEPIHYQIPTYSISQRYEDDISKIKVSAHNPSL